MKKINIYIFFIVLYNIYNNFKKKYINKKNDIS